MPICSKNSSSVIEVKLTGLIFLSFDGLVFNSSNNLPPDFVDYGLVASVGFSVEADLSALSFSVVAWDLLTNLEASALDPETMSFTLEPSDVLLIALFTFEAIVLESLVGGYSLFLKSSNILLISGAYPLNTPKVELLISC